MEMRIKSFFACLGGMWASTVGLHASASSSAFSRSAVEPVAPAVVPNTLFPESISASNREVSMDPDSLVSRADLYRNGTEVAQDYARAAQLYAQAAAQGQVTAMYMLGWMYREGEMGSVDFIHAREWFEKAAAKDAFAAMRELGRLYLDGSGVEKNAIKGFGLMEKAARGGDAWAQNMLGILLREGTGIDRDDTEAVDWFRLAAKNGEPMGDANLGYQYSYGLGVPRDTREAFIHLTTALRQTNDNWTSGLLQRLIQESGPEDLVQYKAPFLALLADPTLVQVRGSLPEALIDVAPAIFSRLNPPEITPLVQQVAAANRPQSAALLTWRAFTGRQTPFDLNQALKYAHAIPDPMDRDSVLAIIESVSASSESDREKARLRLHELAEAGAVEAARELSRRFATGEGEPLSLEKALRFYSLSLRVFPDQHVFLVEDMYFRMGSKAPVPSPSEETLAEAAKKIVAAAPGKERPPTVIFRAPAIYPLVLRMSEMSGSATIEFTVNTEGRVTGASIKSATHPLFGEAAKAAVARWRFVPASHEGKLVSRRVSVPLFFNLDDPSKHATASKGASSSSS